jgi:predicted Zn finger-like uncharacterized protein
LPGDVADSRRFRIMFTVCPKCALTLVVTAADLRIAQGYVRCGRCSSVFNALARLSDERQSAATTSGVPATSPEPEPPPESLAQEPAPDLSPLEEALAHPEEEVPAAPAGAAEEIPEHALEFDPDTTDVRAVFIEPPPNPQWTAAAGSFKARMAAGQESTAAEPTPADSQVDVEIDAAFLGSILRDPAPALAEPEPQNTQRAEPPHTEPPHTEPQHTGAQQTEIQHTEPQDTESRHTRPQRTEAQRSAPAPQSAPQHRAMTPAVPSPAQVAAAATAGAGTRTSAPPGSARQGARHVSPHTRPQAQASPQPHPAPAGVSFSPGPGATPATEPASADAALEADDTELDGEHSGDRSLLDRLRPHAWAAGAAVALLILAAQIINHNRDALATTAPFKRPLTALYASLGVQLAPHWDLRAYDVRQLGASADPAGTGVITVRASIKNAASQPQPLPLLRVTLQDRFGNRIAARDVAPRFYLPRSMPETSYLAGGQRIDAEMGFVDPGVNAVGFEIDACLPASGGVTCANDLATR